MPAYYMNEAAFDLPELGFVDRTVHYLEATSPSGAEITLVVERQPIPKGKTLRELVSEHVAEARKRLRSYGILHEREREVAGGPVIELGIRWKDEPGMMYSRHTHVALGATWLIVAGEGPLEEQALVDECLEQVLGSFRLIE